MSEVNITALSHQLHKYLAKVHRGSEVLVTLHGAVIAKVIVPTQRKTTAKKPLKTINEHADIFDLVLPISSGH